MNSSEQYIIMSIQVWKRQSWKAAIKQKHYEDCCLGSIQIELVLGVGLFDLRETPVMNKMYLMHTSLKSHWSCR